MELHSNPLGGPDPEPDSDFPIKIEHGANQLGSKSKSDLETSPGPGTGLVWFLPRTVSFATLYKWGKAKFEPYLDLQRELPLFTTGVKSCSRSIIMVDVANI